MKFRLLAAVLILILPTGCAPVRKVVTDIRQRSAQEEKLSLAVELIARGRIDNAAVLLDAIIIEKPVRGVTDEALFRLALLRLPSEPRTGDIAKATKLLDQLQRDYPDSPWAHQALPLSDFIAEIPARIEAAGELRRQIKSLRDLNLSLTRENKELRLNLEKLKTLDLELERKLKP